MTLFIHVYSYYSITIHACLCFKCTYACTYMAVFLSIYSIADLDRLRYKLSRAIASGVVQFWPHHVLQLFPLSRAGSGLSVVIICVCCVCVCVLDASLPLTSHLCTTTLALPIPITSAI